MRSMPGAVEEANKFLRKHPDTRKRFDQVSRIVEGFESLFGLELLATTHWVMKHESASTQEAIERQIYKWNDRKRQFSSRQIALAVKVVKAF